MGSPPWDQGPNLTPGPSVPAAAMGLVSNSSKPGPGPHQAGSTHRLMSKHGLNLALFPRRRLMTRAGATPRCPEPWLGCGTGPGCQVLTSHPRGSWQSPRSPRPLQCTGKLQRTVPGNKLVDSENIDKYYKAYIIFKT